MFRFKQQEIDPRLFSHEVYHPVQLAQIKRALLDHSPNITVENKVINLKDEVNALYLLLTQVENFLMVTATDQESIDARKNIKPDTVDGSIALIKDAISTANAYANSHTDKNSEKHAFFVSGLHYFCEYINTHQKQIEAGDPYYKPLQDDAQLQDLLGKKTKTQGNTNTP